MLTVAVRVRPGARRTAVGGRWGGPDDRYSNQSPALVVAVSAPAVDGKANTAVRAAIAAALGVRARDVRIVSGLRSRDKVVEVDGDAATLAVAVARLGTEERWNGS